MRKLLALAIVAAMTTTSFAYLPVSRWANWNNIQTNAAPAAYTIPASGQTNLGSYKNAATQGMFFGELDIMSADPVELLDFEGNNLYTQWSNMRNAATANVYPQELSWSSYANNANCSPLQIGVSGNPLEMFGVKDSRFGIVFQNYGSKAAVADLNGAAGFDFEISSVGVNNIYTVAQTTTNGSPSQVNTMSTDLKRWNNTTNTQWNVGIAKKDLFLSGLSVGLGIANRSNNVVMNAGGTLSYAERYLSDMGAVNAGMPATSTVGKTYTSTYNSDQPEQGSTYSTDLVFQGRYGLMDNFSLQGGLGARFATTINPGGLIIQGAAQGILSNTAITNTASVDVNLPNAAGVATQYYHTATSIVDQSVMTAGGLQKASTLANLSANAMWDLNAGNAGITSVSDKRSGVGPMIEVQGTYTGLEKVNVTGIVHYDTLKQPIAAEVSGRTYVKENAMIAFNQTTEWIQDYQETIKSDGENTISNLDLGGKIEFKAMENLKLAMGAFIRSNNNLSDLSKITDSKNLTYSYSDGLAANNPGTVSTALQPGPAGAGAFGIQTGNGEGTWSKVTNDVRAGQTKVETVSYIIPLGVEIPIYQDKWVFNAGTAYTMTKTKTSVVSESKYSTSLTNATPAGGVAAVPVYAQSVAAGKTQTTTYGETHTTSYTYGIQWNLNKNLTLAMNAILDTNGDGVVPNAVTTNTRATLFDLDTYRNLSIQAVFHF